MKYQRGDAGVGMLVIMAVMMIGLWVVSGNGGVAHDSKESVTNPSAEASPVVSTDSAHIKSDSALCYMEDCGVGNRCLWQPTICFFDHQPIINVTLFGQYQ